MDMLSLKMGLDKQTTDLDRLDAAVERAAACYTPGTYTERRRRRPDLAGASDAIEARLDALYRAVPAGRQPLAAFQQALAEWVDVEGSYE